MCAWVTTCSQVVPYTLAENAGLSAIQTVTELRTQHALGNTSAGINVRKGHVSDITEENVLQPLLVSTSAVKLATETVRSILKIDDIVSAHARARTHAHRLQLQSMH